MGKKPIRTALGLLAAAICLAGPGCAPDTPQAPTAETNALPAPPFKLGALGNSITAGFLNAGLIKGGQLASFPNLISIQAGWGSLEMPLIDDPGVGPADETGSLQTTLYVNAVGQITSDDLSLPEALGLLLNSTYPIPYDNLAVPGATTRDLVFAFDSGSSQSGDNPLFDVILRNSAFGEESTPLEQMASLSPDALTLWIGNNDILGGALSGNPVLGVNVVPAWAFEDFFETVMGSIRAMGTPIVAVANIADIPTTPYFTTVPLGAEVPGVGFLRWNMEEDLDADEDNVVRVLLSAPVADPEQAAGFLPLGPGGASIDTLKSRYTLTAAEVALLQTELADYNTVIEAAIDARGWALVDVATEYNALPKDPADPGTFAVLNGLFPWLPGMGQNAMSAFSLDGIHPSEKGHARVANLFIAALNEVYGLAVPPVDEAAVHNTLGFEDAPTFLSTTDYEAAPVFVAGGRRALEGLSRLANSGD